MLKAMNGGRGAFMMAASCVSTIIVLGGADERRLMLDMLHRRTDVGRVEASEQAMEDAGTIFRWPAKISDWLSSGVVHAERMSEMGQGPDTGWESRRDRKLEKVGPA